MPFATTERVPVLQAILEIPTWDVGSSVVLMVNVHRLVLVSEANASTLVLAPVEVVHNVLLTTIFPLVLAHLIHREIRLLIAQKF